MAVKGALTTCFGISEIKPANKNQAGYDAIKVRTITPTAISASDDDITIPAADWNSLVVGELVRLNPAGSITGLAANVDAYLIKKAQNKIAFAQSLAGAHAGTEIDIGGTLGNARVIANNFKNCGEVTSVGEFGREYQTVRVTNLKEGATRKFKGSFDNGTIQLDLLFDAEDPGQVILERAGESATLTYAFHIELPEGDGGTQEEFYFEGFVASLKRIVGGPDDALMLRCNIELDHRSIVEGTV